MPSGESINYQDESQGLKGFVSYPTDNKKAPCVVICHAWAGQDDFVRKQAYRLAELGYIGFALDMYGDGKNGQSNEENAALMQPFLDDRRLIRSRVGAALKAASTLDRVDSEKLGIMGYCFGGMCALDGARSFAELKVAISFHGLLAPPSMEEEALSQIDCKLLALHGYDDPMVSPDQVHNLMQEMKQKKADIQVHMYGGVMHAFTNPKASDPGFGTVYDPKSDDRSWESATNLLKESLLWPAERN